ncbi:MAG: hypothetical protein O6923_06675, partial [Actinobacteria bacterium]|nr:hypothetical protein [Actinomycetota bacterium]
MSDDGSSPEDMSSHGQGGDWFTRITGVGSSLRQAVVIPALALLSALIIGAVIIAVTDLDTL